MQFSLGMVYQDRKTGDLAENQERAIAYYNAALRIFTQGRFPHEWALTQNGLGMVYEHRIYGEKVKNLEQAVGYYEAALSILRAMGEHSQTELVLANLYNELGRWQEAQARYARVRQDNQLLLSLAETTQEQDPILRSESERAFGEAFALARLGRLAEAALCVERGRAAHWQRRVTSSALIPRVSATRACNNGTVVRATSYKECWPVPMPPANIERPPAGSRSRSW